MKKVVRMLGLCALVALAFTSCKKNETSSTLTFKASITQPKSNDRTYNTQLNTLGWSNGDAIKVFDNTAANYDFTVSTISNNGMNQDQEATFNVTDAEEVAFLKDIATPQKYVAFYPVAPNQFNATDNTVAITVPDAQDHDNIYGHGGSFDKNTYAMFGVNDAANHFQFHSHAGILELNFGRLANRNVVVKTITITAVEGEGDTVVGTMVYPYNYPFTAYEPDADVYTVINNGNQVVFDCGEGITLTEPNSFGTPTFVRFDIAMLRGALKNGFNVKVMGYKDDPNTNSGTLMETEVILMDENVSAHNGQNKIEAETVTRMPNFLLPNVEGDQPEL